MKLLEQRYKSDGKFWKSDRKIQEKCSKRNRTTMNKLWEVVVK